MTEYVFARSRRQKTENDDPGENQPFRATSHAPTMLPRIVCPAVSRCLSLTD